MSGPVSPKKSAHKWSFSTSSRMTSPLRGVWPTPDNQWHQVVFESAVALYSWIRPSLRCDSSSSRCDPSPLLNSRWAGLTRGKSALKMDQLNCRDTFYNLPLEKSLSKLTFG